MERNGSNGTPAEVFERRRWIALYVISAGAMMIIIDGTIVNVALPTIKADLHFSQTSLAWVVNAYLITFGGFLLLSGRLSDIIGAPRLFRIGIVGFTLSSLACGIADNQWLLIGGRAIQGITAAIVLAVVLSLVVTIFTEPVERAKAMGIYGLVLSCGGSIGVFLGGVITQTVSWNWIFLVNVPIGVAVYLLSRRLLPSEIVKPGKRQLDAAGAILVTSSLMLAVYAIINGNANGWTSTETLGLLGTSVVLLVTFIGVELRSRDPLLPLGIFRLPNVAAANAMRMMFTSSMFAFFFFAALYLQVVLGYNPLKVGLAYLPFTVVWGFVSFRYAEKIVSRFGIKLPLVIGMLLFSIGSLFYTQTPVGGNFLTDVLPGMLFMGLGGGIALTPMLLAGMSGVGPERSGTASGLLSTTGMMGGALGLAVMASLSTTRTTHLLLAGANPLVALNSGYHIAFYLGAILALCGAILGALLLRPLTTTVVEEEELVGMVGAPAEAAEFE